MEQPEGERSAAGGAVVADAACVCVYPVTLAFYDIRANEQVQVRLDEGASAYWGDTFAGNRRVGVSLAASPQGALLCLNRFVMNKKALLMSNNQDCAEIRVRLYVHASGLCIDGMVNLPPGARMEMESLVDRITNVQGSFNLNLR
jgi:hypothetical protein